MLKFAAFILILFSSSAATAGVSFDDTDDGSAADDAISMSGTPAQQASGNSLSVVCSVNLDSTSERGCFFHSGSGDCNLPNTGDGFGLCVGGSTADNAGNDLIAHFDCVSWTDSNTTIGTGWHTVGMTTSSSGVPSLWIDGSSVYSGASGMRGPDGTGTTNIGGCTALNPTNYRYVDSQINWCAEWNVELSSGEMSLIHNSKDINVVYQIQPSGLKGFWDLTECGDGSSCSGLTFFDKTSNANNMSTITDTPTGAAEAVSSRG